jgi:hypothetical protein
MTKDGTEEIGQKTTNYLQLNVLRRSNVYFAGKMTPKITGCTTAITRQFETSELMYS